MSSGRLGPPSHRAGDESGRLETPFDLAGRRVFVAGHRGLVGSALVRRLATEHCELLTVPREELDLIRQADVEAWMERARPDVVIIAAAKVGGILANAQLPHDFIFQNVMIAANLIETSRRVGVEKLLYLGSSCIYPKHAPQPIPESALLTGPLEPTNDAYAIAKIAGVRLVQACRTQHGSDFIAALPTNLFGPGDNFDLSTSHVLPALMRKFHEARRDGASSVTVWGSGTPLREFLHVDDCADALVHLLRHYSADGPVNVGAGTDLSIADLARLVGEVVGFKGDIVFDRGKPDGTPRKLLDTSRLNALGWTPRIPLREGIAGAYAWYRQTLGRE
jgi:GDP-L-fucose synthase